MRRRYWVLSAVLVACVGASSAGGAVAQALKRGGTIHVAWPRPVEPACVADCPNLLLGDLDLVLARPLTPLPTGWGSGLAARATTSRYPFAVTFHLRPEARWSDGRPVTAQDWVFTHRLALKYANLPEDHFARADVARVDAVDAKTVRVVLRSTVATWRWRFWLGTFTPFPRHVLRDEPLSERWDDAIVDPRTGRPIANGPFVLRSWDKGRQLVFARNTAYWGRHPAYLDRLVFRFGLENRAEALRRGEIDVLGGPGAVNQAAAFEFVRERARGIRVVSTPSNGWEHLDFNVRSGHPALRNKLVRRALAYGIDRQAIARDLYGRFAPPVLDSVAYLTNESEYRPNWRAYRYDVREARRLLQQAGCRRDDDGIFVCAGERLRLRFVTLAGVPPRQRALELMQTQLRAVGVEVVPLYGANFGFLERRDFDAALFAWTKGSAGEVGAIVYSCGHSSNNGGYCSRLLTADLDQLERLVDPARTTVVANRADRRLARDVPVLPLFQVPLFTAYRESVRGIRPNAFAPLTWNAHEWWLER